MIFKSMCKVYIQINACDRLYLFHFPISFYHQFIKYSNQTHITRCKDSGESEKDQVNQKKDGTNSSSEEGNSNAEQDQEESSMWQKCPVITFQTFDDLTGL